MKDSPKYHVTDAIVDAFLAEQRHGTLAATDGDGRPSLTILPFVKDGDIIEVHCVQADPTFAALRANPRVAFLVADFLADYPHEWVDPDDRGRPSLAYRAVNFACEASFDRDPDAVAAALTRLVRAYSPEADYPPLPNDDFYGPRLRQLAVVRLKIQAVQPKFKVGPPGVEEGPRRASLAAGLRGRARPGDARAADVIDFYNRLRSPDGAWAAPGA